MSSLATFTAPYEGVSRRRACGRCHARKVRCDFNNGDGPCTNCIASGDKCELQNRKRRIVKKIATPSLQKPHSQGSEPRASGDAAEPSPTFVDSSFPSPHSLNHIDGAGSNFLNESITASSQSGATPRAQPLASPVNTSPIRRLRTASFVNRGAILPDVISGLDKNADQQEPSISEVDLKVLELYHAFDLPPRAVRQSLVDAFFEHCWTWMPVIDHDQSISESQSYLLLQALFVAGSQMRINGSRYASTEEYLRRVKALLDTNYEKDPMILLAALCIIQWWNPSAPNVVSTMTSRFWVNYGVNIAQQIGLHRKSLDGTPFSGLRRRIWWSLYARDCLVSSAHGRPRAINLADCSVEPPQPEDFPQPIDHRAAVFCSYVSICGILGDLCEMLSRKGSLSTQEKTKIGEALLNWLRSLPDTLRLFNLITGYPKPYNFETSRLYIVFFTAMMVLFRPSSVFSCDSSCAPSVIASRLACQLFEYFLLRDQVHFLGGAYTWQLLVTAIPQLCCTNVPSLKVAAETALDGLEDVLRVLSRKLSSAANNLRNVQLLRYTLRRSHSQNSFPESVDGHSQIALDLFTALGGTAAQDYQQLQLLLSESYEISTTSPFSGNFSQLQAYDSRLDTDFNLSENSSANITDSFTGQTDWILDLMNGLSSWR